MSVRLASRAAAAVLGVSLIVAPTGAPGAPNPSAAAVVADASEAGARAFVERFYDWYVGQTLAAAKSNSGKGFSFIDGIRRRPDSFSPELKRLLEEDYAASSKCSGEVVGLDWDPFLETQDPGPGYRVGTVKKTASGFRVSLDFHNKQYGAIRNPIAQADVAFVGGHWMFVDFVEEPTDPKSRQGLVAILKGYERSGEYRCKP
jgi:hypothetical protein